MLNVLVTGCAGFIGERLSAHLLASGHQVTGIDNFAPSYDVRLKEWRLASLRKDPAFRFHAVDVTSFQAIEAVSQTARFDAIFNLAGRAGVRASLDDPWSYLATNANGMLNLLELARRRDIPKVILASTSSLYGAANSTPFHEDANTDRPLSPYASSKKAAESLAASYSHIYGLDTPVLRYFTVYGPAGRPDMAVFRFVRWIVEGEPVVVYGDGEQERDFTYIDDVARGTQSALSLRGFDVVNLGGDKPCKVTTLIEHIERITGRNAVIQRHAAQRTDVPATWADISKARKLLAWEPEVALAEGLRRTVEWYTHHRPFASSISVV